MLLMDQKVAIVTGGANGMGEATCYKYAKEGGIVVIVDYNEEQGNKVAESINEAGGLARFYNQVDITNVETIQQTIRATLDEFGRIDVLVNCAGGVLSPNGTSDNINMADWEKTIELNLTGTMNVIMEVLPAMKKQKSGKIINFSSLGAMKPYTVVLHYHAAKGAIESLTANLAFELAHQNIQVNVIAPGPILTPFWDKLMEPGEERNQFMTNLAKKEVPMERIGTAEDIAGVALFLGSSLSDFVTGQKINVAGGMGNIVSRNSTFLSSDDNQQVNK